jgi:phosphatidate cytidylyltransferase
MTMAEAPPHAAPHRTLDPAMKRLLTAAAGIPVMLAGMFLLKGVWFFLFVAFFMVLAAFEYLAMMKPKAPHAPLEVLLPAVPAGAAAICFVPGSALAAHPALPLLAAFAALSIGLGALLLFSRTPLAETVAGLGILAFGIPYFVVPIASVYFLQRSDPWLVFLLLGIVWFGDTAAYYIGRRFGRHKMAPGVSPQKSWEGAAAGFLTGILAAAVWSVWRLGRLDPGFLLVAAATAVAAQIGDLVESMLKRGTGVKDSGSVLPGHGGVLDRCDAVLFAAPVLLLGIWIAPLA